MGTGHRDLMSMLSKSAEDHRSAFLEYVSKRHGKNLVTVHSDGAKELKKASVTCRVRTIGFAVWPARIVKQSGARSSVK